MLLQVLRNELVCFGEGPGIIRPSLQASYMLPHHIEAQSICCLDITTTSSRKLQEFYASRQSSLGRAVRDSPHHPHVHDSPGPHFHLRLETFSPSVSAITMADKESTSRLGILKGYTKKPKVVCTPPVCKKLTLTRDRVNTAIPVTIVMALKTTSA